MHDHPQSSSRRLMLGSAVAGLATLTGCATPTPIVPNKPLPSRLVMLPVPVNNRSYVYLPTTTFFIMGKTPTFIQRSQGSESKTAQRITAMLAEQQYAGSAHFQDAIVTALNQSGPINLSMPRDSALADDVVKRWKFAALQPEADAAIYAELGEAAFWALSNGLVFPIIKASVYLTSTIDDERLGTQGYWLRSDADVTSLRSLRPQRQDAFKGVDDLFANPARTMATLYDCLDRVARLIARDLHRALAGDPKAWR